VGFPNRSEDCREMEMKGTDTKLNILVAEHDELNRILLCEILEKYGCTYKVAGKGRTVVDLFLEEHFDLILLDLHMLVMDGFETVRALREVENEGFGHTPIAILSANVLMSETEKAFAEEMDYHLMKPYQPKEIYQLLDKLKADAETPEPDAKGRADHLSRVEMDQVFEKMDCDALFVETLLEKFKDSSAELLEKIREAIRENDCEALVEYTNALKGEFHIFNAAVPVRIAEALERVSRTGCVPDSAQDVVAKLEEDVREIIEGYTEFLNKER
jgi:CheY-like chemotaxis protein